MVAPLMILFICVQVAMFITIRVFIERSTLNDLVIFNRFLFLFQIISMVNIICIFKLTHLFPAIVDNCINFKNNWFEIICNHCITFLVIQIVFPSKGITHKLLSFGYSLFYLSGWIFPVLKITLNWMFSIPFSFTIFNA